VLSWLRKALVVVVIAFALYYLFTNPEGAAAAVRNFFSLFGSVATFFSSLANG